MKKAFLAILLCAAVLSSLIAGTVSVSAGSSSSTTIDLLNAYEYKHNNSTWNVEGDKLHVTGTPDNPFWVASSEYLVARGDRATYSADILAVSGAAVSLSLSETGYTNTAGSAVFLLDFSEGGGYCWFWSSGASYPINSEAKTRDMLKNTYNIEHKYNETINLRMEIYPDGTLEGYIDDILVHKADATAFTHGYLSLYSHACDAYYSNISFVTDNPAYTKNAKTSYTHNLLNTYTEHQLNGTWAVEDNKLHSTGIAENPVWVASSDYRVYRGDRVSYSADVVAVAGQAVALTLSESGNADSAKSLVFLLDLSEAGGYCWFWGAGTTYPVSSPEKTRDALKNTYGLEPKFNEKVNMRMEIYPDGTIECYLNDVQVHKVERTGFTTGYLTLYSHNCEAYYSNIEFATDNEKYKIDNPDTGDSGIIILTAVMLVSATAFAVTAVIFAKKRKEKNY